MCRNEPRLEQLLADPLIRLMMSSDGVDEGDIRRLAIGAASRGARQDLVRTAASARGPCASGMGLA